MAYREFTDSKTVMEDGKRKVLLRKEFICNSFDDLSEMDTSNLLMGSIAYSITDGKIAIYDGDMMWYDANGNMVLEPGERIFGYLIADWPDDMQPPVFPAYDAVNWDELTPVVSGDSIVLTGETNKALIIYSRRQRTRTTENLSDDDYDVQTTNESIFGSFYDGALTSGEALPPTPGTGTIKLYDNVSDDPIFVLEVSYSFGE